MYLRLQAWELYGEQGIPYQGMPPTNTFVGTSKVAYHVREGQHGISKVDWDHFLSFAKRIFPV